jgi:hypothetical protein
MTLKVTERGPLELTLILIAVLTTLIAALRLSELIPITRSPGGSSQNWRMEVYVSAFMVICSIWIYRNRTVAAATLAGFDKTLKLISAGIIGFTIWGALSVIWAQLWAPALLHTLSWVIFTAAFLF